MKIDQLFRTNDRPTRASACRLALFAGALFASTAYAAGFGELTLHSRIGENLLAEVPLLGSTSKEMTDASCYALAPHPGSDLPVITRARIRIIHNKDSYRLLIVGSKPIAEPVFTISLRINCGIDLQHDYVLMPDAPTPLVDRIERNAPNYGNSETDQEAADAPAPRSRKKQRAQGTPGRSAKASRPPEMWEPSQVSQLPTSSGTNHQARKSAPTNPLPPSGDRLVLSSTVQELKPGETPVPVTITEIEERMLKMETTMRSLNQEIESLNTSLQLTTEMLSAKQELQTAQTLQTPTVTAAILTPPQMPDTMSSENWRELAISSLLGGSLAVGLAAYLGRRKHTARSVI